MNNWYAEIYVSTARPTGQVRSEDGLDISNHVLMNRWSFLGRFESYEEAQKELSRSTRRDVDGFVQWK